MDWCREASRWRIGVARLRPEVCATHCTSGVNWCIGKLANRQWSMGNGQWASMQRGNRQLAIGKEAIGKEAIVKNLFKKLTEHSPLTIHY